MHTVHLVCLQENNPLPIWPAGKAWIVRPEISDLLRLVHEALPEHHADAWFFWDTRLGAPPQTIFEHLLNQPVDIWHAGLKLGAGGRPGLLDFVAPTRMFTCDPNSEIEATSWRISLQACLVRSQVLQKIGFLRPEFTTLQGAELEWGYRCLQYGASMRHLPELLHKADIKEIQRDVLPFEDELRFISYRSGRKWTAWAALRAAASGYAKPRTAYRDYIKVRRSAIPAQPLPYQPAKICLQPKAEEIRYNPRVSVLVPSLERYPYLVKLLQQLGEQTLPAHEILVIDQTPETTRQPELYKKFSELPLHVKFLDQAGQCSSRNTGLAMAEGDYILFLDDDDEIPPDLIQRHLDNIQRFQIDASCGVADELNAGLLPEAFTRRRASDVFPTNNTLLRKESLVKSGLFDLAYDHGARADGDLGMRLYLGGAKLLLDPGIRVLHHHAPRGGLRMHKARTVTYAGSRSSLLQRNLPSITELYLAQRYFTPRQAREHLWLSVLGTFSLHGSLIRRTIKILIGTLLLPHTLWLLRKRSSMAQSMLQRFPQIPAYPVGRISA